MKQLHLNYTLLNNLSERKTPNSKPCYTQSQMHITLQFYKNRFFNAEHLPPLSTIRSLYHETLTTTALFLYRRQKVSTLENEMEKGERHTDIRIPKHESSTQFILHPIHFAANNTEQGL